MEIFFLARRRTSINMSEEASLLRQMILLSEEIFLKAPSAWYFCAYRNKFNFDKKRLIRLHKTIFPDTLPNCEDYYESILRNLRYINSKKHKNKSDLKIEMITNNVIKSLRSDIENWHKNVVQSTGLEALLKFSDSEEIYDYGNADYNENNENEDPYLTDLYDCICDYPHLLLIPDTFMKSSFKATALSEMESVTSKLPFGIYQPLVAMPDLSDLSHEELAICRRNILPHFKTISECILSFYQDDNRPFYEEANANDILSWFRDKLQVLLPDFQKNFADNIIITKQYNKNDMQKATDVHLGITSIEHIVDLFVETQTLLPFVGATLKSRLSKTVAINRSILFLFCETKPTN